MVSDIPEIITQSKRTPLEKDVEQRLHRKVKSIGGQSWKFVSINNRGVSDRIVLIAGRCVFVELKRTGGKLSPLQKTFRDKVVANGGEFALVEGFDGVDRFVEKLKKERSMFETYLGALRQLVGWCRGEKE